MEKQLPNSFEAERGILACLLIDPDAFDLISELVTETDFYTESHRMIYQCVSDLASRGIVADVITVCDELERTARLVHIGGAYTISELTTLEPTSGMIEDYARIVAETAQARRLLHAAGQIAALAYHRDPDMLAQSEQILYNVGQKKSTSEFTPLSRELDSTLHSLSAIQRKEKSIIGVPTGFRGLDYLLGGLQKSDLLILAGRPAMGKSSFGLSVAHHAAFAHAHTVGIFSLEMSKEQLTHRLLSYETGIPPFKIRNGQVDDLGWEKLMSAYDRLSQSSIYLDDTAAISLSEMRSKARHLKARYGLDLIIVDYLQLMKSPGRAGNREQEVSEISEGLKAIAKELQVPVLALAQLSRAVESRQSKIPQLSDLRESGAIENNADVVMFIYRDEYYNPETTRPGTADVIVAKHRQGPIGEVSLHFVASETRFMDRLEMRG